jgi:hypothetical protein
LNGQAARPESIVRLAPVFCDCFFERNGTVFCLFKVEAAEVFVRRRKVFPAILAKSFSGSPT